MCRVCAAAKYEVQPAWLSPTSHNDDAIAEAEADLFKAICAQDTAKIFAKYRKLTEAKIELCYLETQKMS